MCLRIEGFAQPQVMSRSVTLMVTGGDRAIKNGIKHLNVE